MFEEDNPYEWRLKNVSNTNPIIFYKNDTKVQNRPQSRKKTEVEDEDFIEFILKKIGGKILDYTVDKGSKYLKEKANQNPTLQRLINFFEDMYMSQFWTYRDQYKEEYFCNLKITNNGNVLIFKGDKKVKTSTTLYIKS